MLVFVYVSAPEAIDYIHVIFNLYKQLNKFVMFINIMKQLYIWCGHCNKVCCDIKQLNKAMLV